MFNKKNILITGGTGSFGQAFVKLTLQKYKPKKLIVYSRDESKQWDMLKKFENFKNLRFIIGDVRDENNLNNSMKDIDYVVHAAATKIVPTAETNPYECIKTNIIGSMNVIMAAKNNNVKKVVALSTDKACNPVNLYGSTKLAADKLFIAGNNFDKKTQTKFSIVRYGNVIGSRGSAIPFFKEQIRKGNITITDFRMTRFLLSLKDCVDFTWLAFSNMYGGEIFVKKIPSIKIKDLADSVNIDKKKYRIIGIRPGEKIHEEMISKDDAPYTYDMKTYYKIIPTINNNYKYYNFKKTQKVKNEFNYISNVNNKWVTSIELKKWLRLFPNYF